MSDPDPTAEQVVALWQETPERVETTVGTTCRFHVSPLSVVLKTPPADESIPTTSQAADVAHEIPERNHTPEGIV
jgi:hypothetical protein